MDSQLPPILEHMASPADLARWASGGRWVTANHLAVLDYELTRAANIPDSRVIVEMPPRHGKSTLSSLWYPIWYRLRYPRRNIMLWSATGRLANRFSTGVRNLVDELGAPLGLGVDPTRRSWEHWALANTGPNEGEFYSAGIGGGATMGAGGHLLLIDDFFRSVEDALSSTIRKKQQEWFLGSGPTTRAEPGASIVIIATRWHADDLIGFVLREALESGETWRRVSMPAIDAARQALWPSRWPVEKLEKRRRRFELAGYPWMWRALYQQKPPDAIDATWPSEYFAEASVDSVPSREATRYKVIALDPALGANEKADYTAFAILSVDYTGTLWVEGELARTDPVTTVRRLCELCEQHHPNVAVIESVAFQSVLIDLFEAARAERGLLTPVMGIRPIEKKEQRIARVLSPYLAERRLKFYRRSPGANLTLEQLRGFPNATYDDGPDALAYAVEMAERLCMYGVEGQRDYETLTR